MRKMNRLFILLFATVCLVIITSVLIFVACSFKVDESNITMDKVEKFMSEIQILAESYGYEMNINDSPVTSSKRDMIININENEYYDIYFHNLGYKDGTGDSLFNIEYYTYDKSVSYNFDSDFFLQISNLVSGYELSTDEVNDFLNSDEETYPPEKYNYKKSSDEEVKKVKGFRWHNWELMYSELKDGSISMNFGGKTK